MFYTNKWKHKSSPKADGASLILCAVSQKQVSENKANLLAQYVLLDRLADEGVTSLKDAAHSITNIGNKLCDPVYVNGDLAHDPFLHLSVKTLRLTGFSLVTAYYRVYGAITEEARDARSVSKRAGFEIIAPKGQR